VLFGNSFAVRAPTARKSTHSWRLAVQPGGRALFSAGLSNVLANSIQPSAQRLIAAQPPRQLPGATGPAGRSLVITASIPATAIRAADRGFFARHDIRGTIS